MADPYQILGINKGATDPEIKSAYRKLAKKYHPDVNQGASAQSRKEIEQKFKEITQAYDVLSDPKKRARFDRGEIDGTGAEKGFGYGGGGQGYRRSAQNTGDPFAGGFGFGGMDDFLSEFFGGAKTTQQQRYSGFSRQNHDQSPKNKGQDVVYTLNVGFVEACNGGAQRVTLENGKTIDITIPKGTETGHKLRLRGQGRAGAGGNGDAIVDVNVLSHPYFVRKEQDLHIDVPVSLGEAILGAQVKVPTLDGSVMVKVPKSANSGTVLRLKGKGVPAQDGSSGDMFAKLIVTLPETLPADLIDMIEKQTKKNPYDPRKKLWN